MQVFLETADVSRENNVTPPTIKADVVSGRLKVAAVTRRGVRLFLPEEVARYKRERAIRRGEGRN